MRLTVPKNDSRPINLLDPTQSRMWPGSESCVWPNWSDSRASSHNRGAGEEKKRLPSTVHKLESIPRLESRPITQLNQQSHRTSSHTSPLVSSAFYPKTGGLEEKKGLSSTFQKIEPFVKETISANQSAASNPAEDIDGEPFEWLMEDEPDTTSTSFTPSSSASSTFAIPQKKTDAPATGLQTETILPKKKITIKYENGDSYEGEVDAAGLPHGQGVLTDAFGNDYIAPFIHGRAYGIGTIMFVNRRRYDGFVEGKFPHGKGKMTFPDDSFLEGTFVKGRCQGLVVCTFPNKTILKFLTEDGFAPPYGEIFYPTGERYEGEHRFGHRHGSGTMFYSDKRKFIGTFRNNIADPFGTVIFEDGEYIGECFLGNAHGLGTLKLPNGDTLQGEFFLGKCNGQATLTCKDGRIIQGLCVNGKFHGALDITFPPDKEGRVMKVIAQYAYGGFISQSAAKS